MINLILCIVFLIIGIGINYYEIKCYRANKQIKYYWVNAICSRLSFFMFGAFLVQTILWICGGPTIIK